MHGTRVYRHHNSISAGDGESVAGMAQLEVLDLAHNRIRRLTNSSFSAARLPALQHLYATIYLLLSTLN